MLISLDLRIIIFCNMILQYLSGRLLPILELGTTIKVGIGGTWASNSIGIHTTKNVGIATTARSDFALYVEGNQYVDGNITVGGTITYEDVKECRLSWYQDCKNWC